MKKNLGIALALLFSTGCIAAMDRTFESTAGSWAVFRANPALKHGKHIVFVTGEEEYRSEETMPMLAHLLAERHGFDCTVLFAIDPKTGLIAPDERGNIPGLHVLDNADLMVIFTRFRELPPDQMKHIAEFLEAGRPVIGLRTATHAFGGPEPRDGGEDPYARYAWNYDGGEFRGGFGQQVLGLTHHSHWGLHKRQSTRGVFAHGARDHPILHGIEDGEIWGPTDVYEVPLPLPTGCEPLLLGEVLQGMDPLSPPVVGEQLHPKSRRMIEPNNPRLPVVWTSNRPVGLRGRVVTMTMGGMLGGVGDFGSEGLRRLFVNACFWATGLEKKIPARADVAPLQNQSPFRKGVDPRQAMRLLPQEFTFKAEDTLFFYGNGMVERLLEAGYLEAQLQLAHPEKHLKVRSLAWTGDEVGHRLRPEGYTLHMQSLLADWKANLVVLGYGMNESFKGREGLEDFRAQYDVHIREIMHRHPAAKLVLLAPSAFEAGTAPAGVSARERNRALEAYSAVIGELARDHGAQFVDLFLASKDIFARDPRPMTMHGMHLNALGGREIGRILAGALGAPEVPEGMRNRLEEVAKAAAQKHGYLAELVRPKNGVLYYGVRLRPEERSLEIPRYHQLIALSERIVHELANRTDAQFGDFPVPSLPPLPAGKTVRYRFPSGTVEPPAELKKSLVTADGYTVNLFASEEKFPELRNPVQLAFDARGRLWVVTMPSFPHTVPGEQPNDKILILEDTNRDGRADKSTVFADGFDALDGIAFHERGVIVSAQSRLLLLNDLDGDGRADSRRELVRGIDVADSHHGGMVATDPMGYVIFSDGVFHRSQFETPFGVVRGIDATTYRLDVGTGRVGAEWQSLTPNPWKVSFNRNGEIFQRYGSGHVLEGRPLTRLPYGAYHPYAHGTVVNYGKGSALSVISSPNFPSQFQQGLATATLLGSYAVSLTQLEWSAGPAVASSRIDILTSRNSTFRPVDVEFGMDGALYVSDFSSLIIGHAQHPMRDPQWTNDRGRIWRVVHDRRPIVQSYPTIAGATMPQLLELLTHEQDLVRHHARIELRKMGRNVIPEVESWIATDAGKTSDPDHAKLEGSWVLAAVGTVRQSWIKDLMSSSNPGIRAAAVQLLRFTGDQIPGVADLLAEAAHDLDIRVQMAAINALSHLRLSRPDVSSALAHLHPYAPAVRQMLSEYALGVEPLRGRSVPVLEISPAAEIRSWTELPLEEAAQSGAVAHAPQAKRFVARRYRTIVDVATPQTAILSVRQGYIDVMVDGRQVLTSDSPSSIEQQVTVDLRAGLVAIEITYRRPRDTPPKVYLFDGLGKPSTSVGLPRSPRDLEQLTASWEKESAAESGVLRVQAVPYQLQFYPRELRVTAGQKVRLVFENPDVMAHNFVLIMPDSEEKIGTLSDQMAAHPDGFESHYVPDSPEVLVATPQIDPGGVYELNFVAPETPGAYPYLCTFPGHWQMMQGVMHVAPAPSTNASHRISGPGHDR